MPIKIVVEKGKNDVKRNGTIVGLDARNVRDAMIGNLLGNDPENLADDRGVALDLCQMTMMTIVIGRKG